MSIETIVDTNGNLLSDDELQQLAEIVKNQQRQRSSLNQGDLVLDKDQASYQVNYYDRSSSIRKTVNVGSKEAIEVFRKRTYNGSWARIWTRNSGGRQDKFIRMLTKRQRHVLEPLELMQTMFKHAVIDIPLAKAAIEAIEDETAKVRAVFEEQADKLPELIAKHQQREAKKKLKSGAI